MEISDLLKNIHLIEIRTRKKLPGGIASSYKNVFRGQGVELAEVREYVEGDDIRLIDWNVSARMGHLHVKQLMEERELNIITAIQSTASMNFGSVGKTKYQVAAETSSMIIFSALLTGDRAGVVLFGGVSPMAYIPPGKGTNHGYALLKAMIERQVEGKLKDVTEFLRFLAHGLKKRSVVFLMGDFIYGQWPESVLEIVSRRHDLICVCVLDPMELVGPLGGLYWLSDEENIYPVAFGKKPRKRYIEAINKKIETAINMFRKIKADFIMLYTDSPYEIELHKLFLNRIKEKST